MGLLLIKKLFDENNYFLHIKLFTITCIFVILHCIVLLRSALIFENHASILSETSCQNAGEELSQFRILISTMCLLNSHL
jgi:hypothetical protein